MKYYVTFDRIISAIINMDDVDIDSKTLSFYNVDPVIMGFAKIYSDIADMNDRTIVIEEYEYNIARMIRKICQYVANAIGYTWHDGTNMPDRYTTIVYNLLGMGICPTADLFNILNDTGHGLLSEHSFSAGEDAMLTMAAINSNYYKSVNDEFFENYVAFESWICGDELNTVLNTNLPTTLTEWLTKYEWSPAECKYIFSHFDGFIDMYEMEVCGNE